MSLYQIAFLINPVSGDGLGLRVKNQLPEIMRSFGYVPDDWKVELTEKNRLVQQTQQILAVSSRVIAVGGDGTMGLVLNQLRQGDYSHTQVGLIPLGTGNDLGRILGIYQVYKTRGLLACIKRLIKATSTDFNLWKINNDHTLTAYISLGMDAAILHDVDNARKLSQFSSKALFNKILFLKFFLKRLNYKIELGAFLELSNREKPEHFDLSGYCSCIVANINSYGGGSALNKEIQFNDNKLDVLLFKSPINFFLYMTMTRLFPRVPSWIYLLAEKKQSKSINIHHKQGEYIQLDGEILPTIESKNSLAISLGPTVSLLDLRKAPFHIF